MSSSWKASEYLALGAAVGDDVQVCVWGGPALSAQDRRPLSRAVTRPETAPLSSLQGSRGAGLPDLSPLVRLQKAPVLVGGAVCACGEAGHSPPWARRSHPK